MSNSLLPAIRRRMHNVGMLPDSAPLQTDTGGEALTYLTMEATFLFKHLLDPRISDTVYLSLSNIQSLCITHILESPLLPFCFDDLIDEFLNLLKFLSQLQQLKIDTFVRPHPGYVPRTPLSTINSRLSVKELIVCNTHGPSLTFLLSCIQAESLALESCRFTDGLPTCPNLTLRRIDAFPELEGIFSQWVGAYLMIQSCSFVHEQFVSDAIQRMQETGDRMWPGVEQISFVGYPHHLARGVSKMLKLRSRLCVA